MKKSDCPHYGSCAAALCPLDKDLLQQVWFPTEAICRQFPRLKFIKNQHKLKRIRAARGTYFTYEMLIRKCTYTKAMSGINTDYAYKKQFEIWCIVHPERKQLDQHEIELREHRINAVNNKRHQLK